MYVRRLSPGDSSDALSLFAPIDCPARLDLVLSWVGSLLAGQLLAGLSHSGVVRSHQLSCTHLPTQYPFMRR